MNHHGSSWMIMHHHMATPSLEKERQTHSFTPKRPSLTQTSTFTGSKTKTLRRVCFVLIFHWYSSIDSEACSMILTLHPKQNKSTNHLPRPGFSHLQLRNIWSPSSQARDAQPQRFNDMSQPPMAPIRRRVFREKNWEIFIRWLPRSIFEWNTPWPK